MSSKNLKVRIAVSSTLAQLALTSQFQLDAHFDTFWPQFSKTIDDSDSYEPVINTLLVLRRLFRSKEAGSDANFLGSFQDISGFLLKSIQHDYSKVMSNGLRVTGSFLHTLRRGPATTIDGKYASVVAPLHDAILDKLNKVDIDQEVKKCSILCAASLVSVCHSTLSNSQKDMIFSLFNSRLSNELTRDASIKGLTMIALNKDPAVPNGNTELIPINKIEIFLPQFFDLLHKAVRQLHLHTLECLEALTSRYGAQLAAHAGAIQNEIAHMISEEDFQRAVLALRVSTNLIQINSKAPHLDQGATRSVHLSKAEISDQQVISALSNYFLAAAKAKIIQEAHVTQLLNQVTLKSSGAAACLAICIKNQYGNLLNTLW